MLTVGSSLQTAARIKEAGPFGPASVAYWVFSELSLAAHALLGDEQDASGDNEDATDDIEDRGTNATGAGKDSAGLVDNIRCNCVFTNDTIGCLKLYIIKSGIFYGRHVTVQILRSYSPFIYYDISQFGSG